MLKGRIRLTYADREEILEAGDLFCLPPGHTPLVEEDTEFVEFSRPEEHQPVLDHVQRTVAAASAT
jgi:quercetin dioxygenase-like cupin family protein